MKRLGKFVGIDCLLVQVNRTEDSGNFSDPVQAESSLSEFFNSVISLLSRIRQEPRIASCKPSTSLDFFLWGGDALNFCQVIAC